MCGIVGCILKENNRNVAPILFDCISKLEYRGYDSIGLATYDGNIHIKKDKGKIMKVLMPKVRGMADGGQVNRILDNKLS